MMAALAKKILVVEDDRVNQKMLCIYLEKSGYEVSAVDDGGAALAAIAEDDFDLVLLDEMMPVMSGTEVLTILRASPKTRDLPVIMATAVTESDAVSRALEIGADDYVTKPFDFQILVARIKTRIKTRSQPRQMEEAIKLIDVKPGVLLTGRYLLEGQIGEGSYGTVYRARHVGLDTPVAIKVLELRAGDNEALERFQAEGVSACKVDHPNAVRVMDFGVTSGGVAFLAMELLSGRSLEDEIKQQGKLSPERCLEILMPVCYVLANAHSQGIIHRDIKPANIFLHQLPDREVVKVLDFGIAKFVGENTQRAHETADRILGTPAYMAPERVASEPYDGRVDVYSVATMLYEMLSGKTPFGSLISDPLQVAVAQMRQTPTDLIKVAPEVPPKVAAVVHHGMTKSPDDRPSVEMLAVEFAEAVQQFTSK